MNNERFLAGRISELMNENAELNNIKSRQKLELAYTKAALRAMQTLLDAFLKEGGETK